MEMPQDVKGASRRPTSGDEGGEDDRWEAARTLLNIYYDDSAVDDSGAETDSRCFASLSKRTVVHVVSAATSSDLGSAQAAQRIFLFASTR